MLIGMPDSYTLATCVLLLAITSLYALLLRKLRRWYEPRWVWLTVVIGDLLVGLLVGVRLVVLPIPAYDGATLMVWSLWQWFWHFAAGGFPIVAWQVIDDRAALAAALKAALASKSVQP